MLSLWLSWDKDHCLSTMGKGHIFRSYHTVVINAVQKNSLSVNTLITQQFQMTNSIQFNSMWMPVHIKLSPDSKSEVIQDGKKIGVFNADAYQHKIIAYIACRQHGMKSFEYNFFFHNLSAAWVGVYTSAVSLCVDTYK